MNSSSKVIMAATMVMVVSLVMVLSLVLVLLAELYCSLLLRRRRHNSLSLPITTTVSNAGGATTTTTLNQVISTTSNEPSPSPSNIDSLSNPLYTGVLQTPNKTHFHHEPSLQASLELIQETTASSVDNFIYISNPIYSNEATSKQTTPFETPQSSPSRLEDDEDDDDITEEDSTPTLSPMKDLPEKACSVSLKDVETSPSGDESNSKNKNNGKSSSSSGSPYTSPSW
ncbi:PREDICTED: uncharacterized protein LOC104780171 [Camelina sativa]|uniref:Uncharacterized protein LOC104780171 n=1 Tax=Camelina sativa TaxID=90675 RepID=A0ABM0YLT6_CAMSA|nr:PREDICTED: uncharacterized protein LOC104780171 [Camelina sativa]